MRKSFSTTTNKFRSSTFSALLLSCYESPVIEEVTYLALLFQLGLLLGLLFVFLLLPQLLLPLFLLLLLHETNGTTKCD